MRRPRRPPPPLPALLLPRRIRPPPRPTHPLPQQPPPWTHPLPPWIQPLNLPTQPTLPPQQRPPWTNPLPPLIQPLNLPTQPTLPPQKSPTQPTLPPPPPWRHQTQSTLPPPQYIQTPQSHIMTRPLQLPHPRHIEIPAKPIAGWLRVILKGPLVPLPGGPPVKGLADFLPPPLHPMAVFDPDNTVVLAVMAVPAFYTEEAKQMSDVSKLKERMMQMKTEDTVFSIHGLFLSGITRKISDYDRTNVIIDVVNRLRDFLNKDRQLFELVHSRWPDLHRWRTINYDEQIPLTSLEIASHFELLIYEYLTHGIPMGVDIEYYVILALDLFSQLNLATKVKPLIGTFNRYGDMEVIKSYSGDELRTFFMRMAYPRPFKMRLICTAAPAATDAPDAPDVLQLLAKQRRIEYCAPSLYMERREPPKGRLCFLSELKFRYNLLAGTFVAHDLNWGCNFEDDTANLHLANHPDHSRISILSIMERYWLNF